MSYFKDENKNPLDYYGLRQPASKQVFSIKKLGTNAIISKCFETHSWHKCL